jgi:hypothetical protein
MLDADRCRTYWLRSERVGWYVPSPVTSGVGWIGAAAGPRNVSMDDMA